MIERIALKPCPFCGAPAELEEDSDHHGTWFNLGCSRHWGHESNPHCIAGRIFYTETEVPVSEAIAAWNNRTTELSAGDGVQQVDREAVAELYRNVGKPGMADELVSGNMDDHSTLGAFTRHRTLAAAAERARIVAWLRDQAAEKQDREWMGPLDLADAIEAGEV